jgi:hypothetical protein
MAIQSINVPNIRGYDFGVGIDRLSGTPMNQVVKPAPSPPVSRGAVQSFDVSRCSSTEDLQKSLGIDIEASYGCAAFGAGASARFSYMKESAVHSSTLFMTVTANVYLADLSIDDSQLTDAASQVANNPEVFTSRYGDMFCRACSRGGVFVGVMRVETFSSTDANKIETELRGSYGFFSAEAQVKFSSVTTKYNTSLYCSIYTEGGPKVEISNPSDPTELLKNANMWMTGVFNDPDRYARPYEWTLSPIAIAEGPLPPNSAQIQHVQDVLQFCARERTDLLDQLNLLDWFRDHADRYDWSTTPVTRNDVAVAARSAQQDLDLVAGCASAAINDPTQAKMPAKFAADQDPPVVYRAIPIPAPLPEPALQMHIQVASLVGLRALPIKKIIGEPHTTYSQIRDWAQQEYEDSRGVLPSEEQYNFIRSGADISFDRPGASSTSGWWFWVAAQDPISGTVTSGTKVVLTVKGGSPPPAV